MTARVLCAALLAIANAFAQATSIPAATGSGGGSSAFTGTQNGGTDVICALHADTIAGVTCNNQTSDATSETAFASTVTIPAGTLSNTTITHNIAFSIAPANSLNLTLRIRYGGTLIYQGGTAATGTTAGASAFTCMTTATAAASASTPLVTTCTTGAYGGSTPRNTLLSATALSVTANTAVSQVLTVSAQYSANTTGNAIWLYSISPGGGPGATGPAATLGTAISYTSHTLTSSDCGNSLDMTGTLTLSATPPSSGCPFVVRNESTSPITIAPGGATVYDTIAPGGSTASRSLQPGQSAAVWTNGSIYDIGYNTTALTGTTASFGGGALSASCVSGVATVTGALTGRPVSASPSSDISASLIGLTIQARVSAANTVTVTLCGTGTPTAGTWLVGVM